MTANDSAPVDGSADGSAETQIELSAALGETGQFGLLVGSEQLQAADTETVLSVLDQAIEQLEEEREQLSEEEITEEQALRAWDAAERVVAVCRDGLVHHTEQAQEEQREEIGEQQGEPNHA